METIDSSVMDFAKQLLSSLEDRDKVLKQLLTRLIKDFHVERGSVWAVEGDIVVPIFSLNQQGEEDRISESLHDLQIPLGQGYVGKAAATGEPNLENTLEDDTEHYKGVDKVTKHITKNIISIPLNREDTTIGVVQLLDRVNNEPFSQKDADRLMQDYAPWATIALDNANLYFELQEISNFGRELVLSLNREEVLRRLLQKLIKEFSVERGSVWFVEGDTVVPVFSLNREGNEDEISKSMRDLRVPVGEGFVGRAAATGEPNLNNAPQQESEHYREVDEETHHTTRNIISMPLNREETTIGVVQLLDRINNKPFRQRDKDRLMKYYAPWATIALDNALLYEEREDLVNDIIHQMGNDLGDARMKLHFFEREYMRFSESVRKSLDSFDVSLNKELSNVNERLGRSVKYIRANLETPRESNKEFVPPKELVAEAIELSGIRKEIDLYNQVPDDLPEVQVLRKAASIHFLEILTNASKAITNGRLRGSIEKGEIIITGNEGEKEYLELRFTNNGAGIPEDQWELIFYRNKVIDGNESNEFNKGSGYGLWRARRFFVKHGGNIKVESSGEGKTTFLITLPYAQSSVDD